MKDIPRLSRHRVAQLVAQDISPGSYVNMGLGIPTLVAKYLDPDNEVILHSENGLLGIRDLIEGDYPDEDLINASKNPVQLILGASISDQATSFAMMRGGHLDATILGAFQVSQYGDLASWSTGDSKGVPGIGGAMDLVAGARRVIVAMEHTTREGKPKLVETCTYPLTGCAVVHKIYTDLAILDIAPNRGFQVRAMAAGLTRDQLSELTAAPLQFSDDLSIIS